MIKPIPKFAVSDEYDILVNKINEIVVVLNRIENHYHTYARGIHKIDTPTGPMHFAEEE